MMLIDVKPMLCSIKSFMTEEIELTLRNGSCVLMHCLTVILVESYPGFWHNFWLTGPLIEHCSLLHLYPRMECWAQD